MITLIQAKQFLGLSDRGVSIVGDGTTATCSSDDHGLKTGSIVQITSTTSFNGIYSVIVLNSRTFTFAHAHVGTESGLIAPHDAKLNILIAGVTNYINKYTSCEWSENLTGYNKILDCPADGVLYLPKMPTTAITEVLVSVDKNFSDSTKYASLTENTDFLFYDDVGRLELMGDVATQVFDVRKSIKVTYNTGALPDGIMSAAYALLRYFYQMENDKAHNLTSRTNAQDSQYFDKSIPDFITEQLDPYKRIGIGEFTRAANPIII